jgi:hypothetical protein
VGDGWENGGTPWHSLAAIWLRAEGILAKTGRNDLQFKEIHASSLPPAIKDWMCSRIMQTDAIPPAESFGNDYTDFLGNLPWTSMIKGNAVLDQVWCRPGKTGIVFLLVGLHWQAVYSGAGKKWERNLKLVDTIFRTILAVPSL